MLRVRCSLRKNQHHMIIFWSESRGYTVKKAKVSVGLRKQEVDVLPVQSRAPRLSMMSLARRFTRK